MNNKEASSLQKLVRAGLILAKKGGIEGFSVRQLCSKAKVNLGLFHYHFSSRQNFNKEVLKELYKELLKELDLNISDTLKPIEKLKIIVAIIGKFSKNNSSLLLSIIADVFSGNKEMLSFLKDNFTKHISLIMSIIEECKKQGFLKDCNTLSLLFSFVAPIAIPNIAAEILKRNTKKKDYKKIDYLISNITSEKLMEERMEIILNGALNGH